MADPLSAGIAFAGILLSEEARSDQKKELKKARAEEKKREDIRAARSRRAEIRKRRQISARITSAAHQRGAVGSSSVAGGIAAVGTQTAGNIGTIFAQQQSTEAQAGYLASAQDAASLSALGITIFSNADRIGNIFSPAKPPVG